jgi:hypothetical protein
VRDLVVGDRERAAGTTIEQLAVARLLHAQEPLLVQHAVDEHRRGRAFDAVLRQHDDMRVLRPRRSRSAARTRVEVRTACTLRGSSGPKRWWS